MSKIQSFKDLLVWQKSMELAARIYELSAAFPADERFGLTAEMRKTVRSVPYNIAEGKSRFSPREFRQFVSIAKGSAGELQTQILLAHRLKYMSSETLADVEGNIEEIGRMPWGLGQSLS